MINLKYSILTVIALLSISLFSQEEISINKEKQNYYRYENDFLSKEFHRERREKLRELLPEGSAAVFYSAPERNRSNDVYFEYHQDPNFYYLTGLTEPNAMLIIYKDKLKLDGKKGNEILFIQEKDPLMEIWNGRRVGDELAKDLLGFEQVLINKDFKGFDSKFNELNKIFIQQPHAPEEGNLMKTSNLSGLYANTYLKVDSSQKIVGGKVLQAYMAKLRQVKTDEELKLLRKAISITCSAQNELMKNITPEMHEYETEAIIEYEFKRSGAEYPGFPSIQGSGENSCVLHYTSNRRPLINGGLLVSDVGAEYHGYTADVTRTIPPSGKFSEEEKLVYQLVFDAQEEGIKQVVAGNSFWSAHTIAKDIIAEGLVKLGITKEASEVGKYFMHGTSHYLGLDVHDAGIYTPLEEGVVITVEPGIYISEGSDCDPKWWNIGVRIEDDILVTKDGPENLSVSSPRTIEEIEKLMNK